MSRGKAIIAALLAVAVTGCDGSNSPAQPKEQEPISGVTLITTHDNVAVIESPYETVATTVTTINKGQELTEASRKGGWVQVAVASTGKVGWVPAWAVQTKSEVPAAFGRFRIAFDILNDGISQHTGVKLFIDAKYMGGGIVNVTATDTWMAAPLVDRQANLNTIYEMWRAAEGSGIPLFVNILDPSGNIVMSKGG